MFRQPALWLLGFAMVGWCAATAQDPHDHQQTKRYYDKNGKDYHEWNKDEDRKYHDYLTEKHLKEREFATMTGRQQALYFSWSHKHDPGTSNKYSRPQNNN